MEAFYIDGALATRSFPCGLPVDKIMYAPRKTGWIERSFHTTNFSLILAGSGGYSSPLGAFRVEAPCVIMQPAGVPVRYGPARWWSELSLLYASEHDPELRRRGLYRDDRHAWYCGDAAALRERMALLAELGQRIYQPGAIDRIDRLCEQLVMNTLLDAIQGRRGDDDAALAAVRRIRRRLEDEPLGDYDFDALAAAAGLSVATFRRRWNLVVGMPPARYQRSLRLARAAQLLLANQRSVAEIAAAVGFADPLYFSRAFRRHFGASPSGYRRRTLSAFA